MNQSTLSAFAIKAVPAIANHLWQSSLFFAAIGLLNLLLRHHQARIRYFLWLAASIKFLLPFSLLIALGSLLPQPRRIAAPSPVLYSALDIVAQPFAGDLVQPRLLHAPVLAQRLTIALPIAFALWLLGIASLLFLWIVQWRQLSATLKHAAPINQGREIDLLHQVERQANVRRPIPILQSPNLMEPAIFGVFHPTLIWPARLSDQLEDHHIEAILTHELAHVQRRDNLTAALHMLVEALFWFHPFVWWIERRMVEERERACDEAVIQLGGAPEIYAEGLLKTCRFCVESPLPCVSGISRAGLSRRVLSIMSSHNALRLTLAKKLVLAAIGLAAVTAPLVFGQANAILHANITSQPTGPVPSLPPMRPSEAGTLPELAASKPVQPPILPASNPLPRPLAFEVVSIRQNKSGDAPQVGPTPNGFLMTNLSLAVPVLMAYVPLKDGATFFTNAQTRGFPDWALRDHYDIEAKVSEADLAEWQKPAAQPAMLRAMLQALLVDRCNLTLHRDSKEVPVYSLLPGKSGPKFSETDPAEKHAGQALPMGGTVMPDSAAIHFYAVQMTTFAVFLSNLAGRPVRDDTGLPGKYDLALPRVEPEGSRPAPPADGAPVPDPGPSIFTAVQALGLKLEPAKGQIETLVIDHIDRPSEN